MKSRILTVLVFSILHAVATYGTIRFLIGWSIAGNDPVVQGSRPTYLSKIEKLGAILEFPLLRVLNQIESLNPVFFLLPLLNSLVLGLGILFIWSLLRRII